MILEAFARSATFAEWPWASIDYRTFGDNLTGLPAEETMTGLE
jgi:hypothetical protein